MLVACAYRFLNFDSFRLCWFSICVPFLKRFFFTWHTAAWEYMCLCMVLVDTDYGSVAVMLFACICSYRFMHIKKLYEELHKIQQNGTFFPLLSLLPYVTIYPSTNRTGRYRLSTSRCMIFSNAIEHFIFYCLLRWWLWWWWWWCLFLFFLYQFRCLLFK